EKHIVSIGSGGTVACIDRKTGKLAWSINLAKDYELAITKEAKSSKLGVYGVSQNPLIDGDAVVIAACTPKALMIKVELATGKILWKTENPKNWTMTFTSITPITFQAGGGQKHYVYSPFEGVVGISATNGKILWEYPEWKAEIWNEKADPPNYLPVIPSPIVVAPDKLFFCAQNVGKLGCLLLQLTKTDSGNIEPKQIFREKNMASGIQTPIYFDGRLYGNGTDDGFICFSLEGKMLWRQKKMGPWPYLIADSMIYILSKSGQLHLLDATTPEFKELATWQIPFEGPKYYDAASWSPMAISNGRLILRLGDELVALLVK
ncbi:MAG: PQQ-like beta-propeller repeat protein, partial [Phycisphaerales bacterium]|nr:PQQ-like beta-propeller repeat protein [Phycisphaerales bacterium]